MRAVIYHARPVRSPPQNAAEWRGCGEVTRLPSTTTDASCAQVAPAASAVGLHYQLGVGLVVVEPRHAAAGDRLSSAAAEQSSPRQTQSDHVRLER